MTLKKVYNKIRTAIIYEIVCLTTGERYIGSSVKTLKRRIENHEYNTFRNIKNKCISKKILLRKNYKSNVIETFETRFLLPILLKEQYYIDTLSNINKKRALDLYKKNKKKRDKEESKERSRNYRNNNQEKIKEFKLKNFNCVCGSICKLSLKARHLQTNKHKKYLNSL